MADSTFQRWLQQYVPPHMSFCNSTSPPARDEACIPCPWIWMGLRLLQPGEYTISDSAWLGHKIPTASALSAAALSHLVGILTTLRLPCWKVWVEVVSYSQIIVPHTQTHTQPSSCLKRGASHRSKETTLESGPSSPSSPAPSHQSPSSWGRRHSGASHP